jgi:hypothetical protein
MTFITGYRACAEITGTRCVVSTLHALRGGETKLDLYDFFRVTKSGWLTGYWSSKCLGTQGTKTGYYRDALVRVPFRKFTVQQVTSVTLLLEIG